MIQILNNYNKKHKRKLFCDAFRDGVDVKYVWGITITNENLNSKNDILNLTNEREVA
jgi:hypothetical protein